MQKSRPKKSSKKRNVYIYIHIMYIEQHNIHKIMFHTSITVLMLTSGCATTPTNAVTIITMATQPSGARSRSFLTGAGEL